MIICIPLLSMGDWQGNELETNGFEVHDGEALIEKLGLPLNVDDNLNEIVLADDTTLQMMAPDEFVEYPTAISSTYTTIACCLCFGWFDFSIVIVWMIMQWLNSFS
jgi:hypothetical protein